MKVAEFIPIIGLEVHVELKTKSKMFCGCSADYFGHEPNTHCCPVCLGLPGALPVPNKKAIEWCIMLGLALNCQIPEVSKFDRKNYFYPDLPKGYQISQYDMPLCVNGELRIKNSGKEKKIRIRRVHMEEDTGKLIHTPDATLIDFNRSGVPLVEVVTEPDIHSGEEAKMYLQKLQQIIRYLGISDADMEKGSMRCEPNISILPVSNTTNNTNDQLPDYKVEVKNINSFKFVGKAIDYEIDRQIKILEHGEKVVQETRGWSEIKGVTLPQRSKEEAQDYRYFPEPDIPPMRWSQNQISKIKNQIPEMPDTKLTRFMKDYELGEYDALQLTTSLPTANYYEESIKCSKSITSTTGIIINPKTIANWIINKKVDINKVSPKELLQTISQMGQTSQISDKELEKIVVGVLKDNQKAVDDYKKGKEQALMFLVGQIMRKTKRQANGDVIKKLIIKKLKKIK